MTDTKIIETAQRVRRGARSEDVIALCDAIISGSVAQPVEPTPHKRSRAGSNPAAPTKEGGFDRKTYMRIFMRKYRAKKKSKKKSAKKE